MKNKQLFQRDPAVSKLLNDGVAAVREAAVQESILRRMAEPEDVADSVVFLCGDESRHITGQVLRVDGGQYI